MTAHAIVTNYGNERADEAGGLRIDVYFIIHDPDLQGSGAGLDGTVLVSSGVELADASATEWTAAIKDAIVATGVSAGFMNLVNVNVPIPTIA